MLRGGLPDFGDESHAAEATPPSAGGLTAGELASMRSLAAEGDADAFADLARLGLTGADALPPPMVKGTESDPIEVTDAQAAALAEAGLLEEHASSAGASTLAAQACVVNTAATEDVAAAAAAMAATDVAVATPDEYGQGGATTQQSL